MPKKRDINLFLKEILEAIESIKAYTKDLSYETKNTKKAMKK